MSLLNKILIFLGATLLIGMLAFIIYQQHQISTRQTAIETNVVAQKNLIDGIVRSQSSWATKSDMEQFAKDNKINLEVIQKDLDKLHADVAAVNVILTSSDGQIGNNIPSTGTGGSNPKPPTNKCPDGTPCPNSDPYGYQLKTQLLSLNEKFGNLSVPIGSVGFSVWQAAPWSIDIKPRDYNVSTVVGHDENERLYFYNKFSVTVDGKAYDLPIKTATTEQVYPTAKWSFWNPRLYLGVSGGVNVSPVRGEFTPSLGVSVISYGKYKTQPTFTFLEVGAGYGTVSGKPQLVVTPVTYNVGEHIPLTKNIYVGPSIGVGTDGGVSFMGSIRVGL